MKKFSYVLAALATIAIAAPAIAQDKPMMGDGMKKPMMRHHHHMMQKHAMHKHAMHKRMTMKKDSM
jgi:pentapeptide MXKDX repeat protein